MDNDPKSYRVPILHLTDVLPVEDVPTTGTTPTPPTPVASTPVTPVVPPPQVDESQKLHEAFIAKTQAELRKKAEAVPAKKKPIPTKKTNFVASTPHTPKPLPKTVPAPTQPVPIPPAVPVVEKAYGDEKLDENVVTKSTGTVPKKIDAYREEVPDVSEETDEYLEDVADIPEEVDEYPEEEVLDVPEEVDEYYEDVKSVPEELDTPVEEYLTEDVAETQSEPVAEIPIKHSEPKPDAFIEKKGSESLLEKFVSVAAERLDPLPPHKMKEYTGEEISQLFDTYLRENPLETKPEETVDAESLVEDVSMATFLPDPLDIWEQDATKPKKDGFRNNSKPPEETIPKKEEDILETTFVPKDFVPTKLTASSNEPTVPELQTGWEDEMKKTLTRVSEVSKANIVVDPNPSPVLAKKDEDTVVQDVPKKPEVKSLQQSTPATEDSAPRQTGAPLQRITYTPKEILPTKPDLTKGRFPEREEIKESEVKTVQRGTLTPDDFTPQQTQVPHEEEGVSTVAITNNSNLATLRERIAKEHSDVSSEPLDTASLDTEHATLNSAISQKIETLDTLATSAPVSEEKTRPQSKHAQVLSTVAERLRQMSVASSEKHIDIQTVVNEQVNEAGKETEKKQGPLAPGEIREPVPVPPPNTSISSIRTFRQDVEQAVLKNKTSIVNMISAEENHRAVDATIRTVPQTTSTTLSYVFIGASIALIVGALAIGAFVFVGHITSDKSENTSILSLINKTVPYVITDQSKDEIMSGLVNLRDNTHNDLGSIIEIELHERVIGSVAGSDDILTSRVEPSLFLEKIATNAPGGLVRSATETLILGIHEMTTNQAFLLFKVDHRDTAFRGMFEWEENMDKDLAPLFGPAVVRKIVPQPQQPVATDASSTIDQVVTTPPEVFEKVVYEDLFVFNKEVRGLRNEKGVLVLLWAMPDDSTVLITTNEVTMRTILEQLATQSYSN
jgi:hypothetical protein